jgi:hypothetical protein
MGYQIAKSAVIAITEQDWTRLMGPQGFTVGLLLAVIVLWGNGMVSERNRQKRADTTEEKNDIRHAENRADIKALTESLTNLSAEAIKAQVKSAIVQIENTKAVSDLADEVHQMNTLLAVSPCLVAHQLRAAAPKQTPPSDPAPES